MHITCWSMRRTGAHRRPPWWARPNHAARDVRERAPGAFRWFCGTRRHNRHTPANGPARGAQNPPEQTPWDGPHDGQRRQGRTQPRQSRRMDRHTPTNRIARGHSCASAGGSHTTPPEQIAMGRGRTGAEPPGPHRAVGAGQAGFAIPEESGLPIIAVVCAGRSGQGRAGHRDGEGGGAAPYGRRRERPPGKPGRAFVVHLGRVTPAGAPSAGSGTAAPSRRSGSGPRRTRPPAPRRWPTR